MSFRRNTVSRLSHRRNQQILLLLQWIYINNFIHFLKRLGKFELVKHMEGKCLINHHVWFRILLRNVFFSFGFAHVFVLKQNVIFRSVELYFSRLVNERSKMRQIVVRNSLKICNMAVGVDHISIWRSLVTWYFCYNWHVEALHAKQIFTIKGIMLLIFVVLEVFLMLFVCVMRYYQVLYIHLSFSLISL